MTKLQVINNVTANTSFQAKPTGAKTTTNPNDKGVFTTTKVVIGAGLTALAAAGIYIATRGKSKVVKNPASGLNELVVNFKKGIAELPNGEKYTGEVVKELKDGSKVTLEYLDGVLQKSTKTKDGEKVFEKLYSYLDNGKIKAIQKDGKSIFTRTMKDGVETITTSNAVITKEKNLIDILRNDNYFVQINTRFRNKVKEFDGYLDSNGLAINENSIYDPIKRLRADFVEVRTVSIDAKLPSDNMLKRLGVNTALARPQEGNGCVKQTLHGFYPNNFTIERFNSFPTPDTKRSSMNVLMNHGGKSYNYDTIDNCVTHKGKTVFKYNPRTKELSDLKIDEKEAKEIIKQSEEYYDFYRRAMSSKKRSLRT